MKIRNGYLTALGTPLNADGMVNEESLRKEIDQQIVAGASGLLLMGSMGMLGCVPDRAYEPCIATACDQVAGRVPLLVGATDNSFARVKDRLDILARYPVCATLTPPYYFMMDDSKLVPFFSTCAAMYKGPMFLYDHLPITKHKLTFAHVRELAKMPNIVGIKSADMGLIRALHEDNVEEKCGFTPIISDIACFAKAYAEGVTHYLDGLFSCIPHSVSEAQKLLEASEYEAAKDAFDRIIAFRDELIAIDLWPAFSYAMNLLGCDGNFAPDYEGLLADAGKEQVKEIMCGMGELSLLRCRT